MQQEVLTGRAPYLDMWPSTLPEGGFEFLQEADPARLQKAVADNHCHWFRRTTTAAGGAVIEEGGLLQTYPPGGQGNSMIAFPSLPDASAGSILDALVEEIRQRRPLQIVGCWSLLPSEPADLGARLFARGFGGGWQPHWMWLELSAIRADPPYPRELTIEPVESVPDWDLEDLPNYNRRDAPHIFAATRARPYRIWHFAARLDGRLVGHSALNLTTGPLGVAGIYDVGVIPAARNRGIGRAVTAAACLFAREIGCRHALLNATGMGEPVYRRLGFQSIGHGQTWWWPGERIDGPPATPLQVAFAEALGRGDRATLDALAADLAPEMLAGALPCGMRPLELTVETGQPAAAEWLVERGVPLDLLSAWDLGWKERIPKLLAARPELVDARRGDWQTTPLHEAVQRNDVELARLLLAAGADLSIQDSQFRSTPLGWARHMGRAEIAALIEAQGGGGRSAAGGNAG
jgi:GNAT superfamily N-acetyltransferase